MGDPALKSNWQPAWRVDVGHGCEVGLVVDDHCFVALLERDGGWKPTPWVPKAVSEEMAKRVAEL